MGKFLITGLPRSRTAWMAAFMECPHEPSAHMNSHSDLIGFFRENDGCADSSMALWIESLLREVKPRTVIIDRPIEEVERSLLSLFPGIPKTNVCDILLAQLEKVRKHPLVMSVPFGGLDDIATMRKVFWHLRPGVPFDEGRFLAMRTQKIVVNPKDVKIDGTLFNHTLSEKVRLKYA